MTLVFFRRGPRRWNMTQYDLERNFWTRWGARRYAASRRYKAAFLR